MRLISNRFWHALNHSAQAGQVGSNVLLPALLRKISAFIGLIILLSGMGFSTARADAQYVYDETDRLVEVVDAVGNSALYQYDDAGNLLNIRRYTSDDLVIAEFTPNSGPVGTVVTIYGIGFSATAASNEITFNGVAATVSSASPTKLVTTVPTGATTGLITVTVGLKTASSAEPFTVTAEPINVPPVITSFTPTLGSVGTPVTISGLNFDTIPVNNNVQFNNISQATVTSSTSTQISTTVPTNASSGHLNVRTLYGAATSSADFFVLPSGYTAAQVGATTRMVVDGPSLAVNTGTAGKIAMVLFDGIQGQGLGLGINLATFTPSGSATLYIKTPLGADLIPPQYFNGATNFNWPKLPTTGTYTLLIVPATTSSLNATLTLSSDLTGTLAVDGAAQAFTSVRVGQNGRYTFTGTTGQGLGLGMPAWSTTPAGGSVKLIVYKPDNTALVTCYMYGGVGSNCNLPLLPATGNYTVFVDPGNYTASFDLFLSSDVTGTLVAGGDAQVFTTIRVGQNARYTFTGTASQNLSLLLSGDTFPNVTYFYIYKPDGTLFASKSLYYSGTGSASASTWNLTSLPVTGSYTVFVAPSGGATGTLSVQIP